MVGDQSAEKSGGKVTIDQRIRDALLVFGDPVENGVYQGKAKSYFTFSYTSLGDGYGDDMPSHERYLIQIHYFAPLGVNVTRRVKEVKRALASADFTWPEVENADDEDGRHRVFECETAEEADWDG